MLKLLHAIVFALLWASCALAQDDVDQCALACIANVNNTDCNQSQWSCLCADDAYVEQLNNCTYASCNASQQQDTFSVVAELCAVIGVPITIDPQATILTTTSNPILSTLGIPTQSSLPPIVSSQDHFDSTVTSEASSTPTDAATTSTSTGGGGTPQGSVEAATSSASHSSPAGTSSSGDSNGSHKSYSSLLGSWISILGATMTWMMAM
ncbi:hypothetical protein PV10_05644 [Exophiala mesophila]|uniref:CFEM domain-containing protein n=1 Tax=Exophiala mesophila TaxID=212818 RepID=A0A0D1ZAS1_EXOME|nr:uncharacterized protein PV10_05644 [Exophiala mesophila]KIV91059.1 hypothetical protein PV10_05644 [Exophiala mesophila]